MVLGSSVFLMVYVENLFEQCETRDLHDQGTQLPVDPQKFANLHSLLHGICITTILQLRTIQHCGSLYLGKFIR